MNRTESQIYLSGDKFFAINSQTGAEVCNYKAHYSRFAAPAIGPDESIHVTANGDKALVVLNPDCSLKWRTDDRNEFPALQDQNFESLAKSMNHVRRPAIGADGTIYAPSNKTLLAISPTGKILWRFVAVATVSRPVIGGDGVIYFGTSGGRGRNRQYKVYAVNPDGKKKWELGLKDSVPRVASINKNEVIFFKGMESLYAVDKEGKILWYYKLKKRSPYTAYHDEDNTVYVTDGDYLYSLNQDGSLKWRIKGGFRDNPVVGRAGIIYVGSNDKHFYAIDRDGRVVWKYQTNNKVGAFPKLSADGTVYFVNQSKRLYALNVESEGMVDSAWPTFQGDNQNSGRFYVRDQDPAVPDPVVITPPDPGTPGNKKWFFAGCEDNNFMVHPALDSEGTLYFACNQPTSKFFAINPDGTEKWNHDYNNRGIIPHISAPAITPDDNLIYTVGGTCTDTDNSFIECNRGLLVKATPNGTIIWEREIKIETPTSPALGPDGTIYLSSWQLAPGEATDYGRIAAYNPDGELKWSLKLLAVYSLQSWEETEQSIK